MEKALKKLSAIVTAAGSRSEWPQRVHHYCAVTVDLFESNQGDLEQFTFPIDESEVATFRERVGKKVVLTIEDA